MTALFNSDCEIGYLIENWIYGDKAEISLVIEISLFHRPTKILTKNGVRNFKIRENLIILKRTKY